MTTPQTPDWEGEAKKITDSWHDFGREGKIMLRKDVGDMVAPSIAQALASAYRSGLIRAAEITEESETVEAKGDTYYCQLGDASATKWAIRDAILKEAEEPK